MRFGGRREDGRLCRRGAASFCGAFVTVAAAAVVLCAPALHAGASTPQSAPMSLIAKMPGLASQMAPRRPPRSQTWWIRLWPGTGQVPPPTSRASSLPASRAEGPAGLGLPRVVRA